MEETHTTSWTSMRQGANVRELRISNVERGGLLKRREMELPIRIRLWLSYYRLRWATQVTGNHGVPGRPDGLPRTYLWRHDNGQ
jgi:hypothetical protein